ncbi:MAG TPA: hypothetical protein VFO20_15755 [Propionibacteriaceae bacterium]|nr:hypothetical protein [Propionibacteriaceae bacterium]
MGRGLVLILLSLVLLLFGGGLGPPLIGLILGVAALRMHAIPRHEVRRFLSPLARVWEWALVAGVAGYLALLPETYCCTTSPEWPTKPWCTASRFSPSLR